MNPKDSPTHPSRRKRRDGLKTRTRLLEAAIDILSEEGLAALSTVRVAEVARSAQSGVYLHFESVEELTVLAAEQVGERLRTPLLEEWRRFRDGATSAPDAASFRNEHYLRLIAILRREWHFLDLITRYHREPTPLGEMMARFMARFRDDVTGHLLELGRLAGLTERHRPELGYYAHLLIVLMVGAVEALEDGLHPDPARAVTDLAAQVERLILDAYTVLLSQG